MVRTRPSAHAWSLVPRSLKNRYKNPCFNGYQDALYSIALNVGEGLWAVCEVQVGRRAFEGSPHECIGLTDASPYSPMVWLQVHIAAVLSHKEESHLVSARSRNRV